MTGVSIGSLASLRGAPPQRWVWRRVVLSPQNWRLGWADGDRPPPMTRLDEESLVGFYQHHRPSCSLNISTRESGVPGHTYRVPLHTRLSKRPGTEMMIHRIRSTRSVSSQQIMQYQLTAILSYWLICFILATASKTSLRRGRAVEVAAALCYVLVRRDPRI